MELEFYTSANNIKMVRIGRYCWEVDKENRDNTGSDVYKLVAGNPLKISITFLYSVDDKILSIQHSRVLWMGGDSIFFYAEIEQLEAYVSALLKGNNMGLMPLYDANEIIVK